MLNFLDFFVVVVELQYKASVLYDSSGMLLLFPVLVTSYPTAADFLPWKIPVTLKPTGVGAPVGNPKGSVSLGSLPLQTDPQPPLRAGRKLPWTE